METIIVALPQDLKVGLDRNMAIIRKSVGKAIGTKDGSKIGEITAMEDRFNELYLQAKHLPDDHEDKDLIIDEMQSIADSVSDFAKKAATW